jgi:hypothetical protein
VTYLVGNGQRDQLKTRRGRAVKTAWLLAAVAALIFIAFILSGVLGPER